MSGTFAPGDTTLQKSAFKELLVTQPTPVIAQGFPYNLNTDALILRKNGSGTSVQANSLAVVSTAAIAGSFSQLISRKAIKYIHGQGILCRFAGLFSAPAANSTIYAGIGNINDGFFFGYQGTTFGIYRRSAGSSEVRTLTVTTKSSTAESVTVTLDGVAKLCPVTNGADTTVTANEIAAVDFAEVGGGWAAKAVGSTVIFRSYRYGSLAGAYSVAGTTIVGAFAQSVVGATPSEAFVARSGWNRDKADGTGVLPNLTLTFGQVFQVRYQWLGFGGIEFYMERPKTLEPVLVHAIEFADTSVVPSLSNPTLPFSMEATNTSNATIVGVSVSSFGIFHEGPNELEGIDRGAIAIKTGITTETPVLTVRNKSIYASKINRVSLRLKRLMLSTDGTKNVVFRLYRDATLVAASFVDVSTNTSPSSYDVSASAISGGTVLPGIGMAKIDTQIFDLDYVLYPDEQITVTASSPLTVDVVVSAGWEELF